MTATKSFKAVQTDIRILATIFGLSLVDGLKYNQHQLATFADVSKRTAESATKRLEAAGVITRSFGRGRRVYSYQFSGVYQGRFGVLFFAHPCVRNATVIATDKWSRIYPIDRLKDSGAKIAENLRLYE
jgi:hypothetical protein